MSPARQLHLLQSHSDYRRGCPLHVHMPHIWSRFVRLQFIKAPKPCPLFSPSTSPDQFATQSFISRISRFFTNERCSKPSFALFIILLSLLLRVVESSVSLVSSPLIIVSNQSGQQLSASPSTQLPSLSFTHHHHHSHLHLSKLLFPLASSSFTDESIKFTTSQPKYNTVSFNETINSLSERFLSKRDPTQIGRKRKRELFALTISETEPLKTLRPSPFWANTPSSGRRRRVSTHPNSGNAVGTHGNSKLPYSVISPLSALSSSSAMAPNAANAAATGNMRMKIMLNPPGFGPGLVPDQKCNFEIYPSGCFDENGSICDNSGSGLCICRSGYSIRIASVYCLRPASIGEACYTTEQCERKVANSGCFNYREEYREENPSAFFGPSQSSWPMGECRCRIGHRFDELSKSCVRSLIGSWCSNVWDCEMVEDDDRTGDTEPRPHSNHTRHSLPIQMLPWHSGPSHVHGTRAKMANIVCENNICNCSQFFHFNTTAEECQFVETFGQSCRPGLETRGQKRNTRSRQSPSTAYAISSRHHSSYHSRQLRSLPESDTVPVACNMPNICSINGTCVCAEGFEHQATSTPQCQPINKGVGIGGHFTHHGFHGGSSGRSGVKSDHSGTSYDRGHFEGHSNVANFVEYVLYVLVPALVVILMFKPCFRRIGEWRNHIHQYSSDSDFYLSANGMPPVIADCNVIAPGAEKAPTTGQFAPFPAFGPHLGCHTPFIFESVDGCVYGGCLTPAPPADSSLALVREKLQTIEETQSEDGLAATEGCTSCTAAPNSDKQCCMWDHNVVESDGCGSSTPAADMQMNEIETGERGSGTKAIEKVDGIEMIQFNKEQEAQSPIEREKEHSVKEISEMV